MAIRDDSRWEMEAHWVLEVLHGDRWMHTSESSTSFNVAQRMAEDLCNMGSAWVQVVQVTRRVVTQYKPESST